MTTFNLVNICRPLPKHDSLTPTIIEHTPFDPRVRLIDIVMNRDSHDESGERIRKVFDGGYVHATHIETICPRRLALLRRTATEYIHTEGSVSSSDRVVWEMGRAVEKHIRKQLLDAIGQSKSFGVWKCVCGHASVTQGYDLKRTRANVGNDGCCTQCKHEPDTFHELPIWMDTEGLVLSPDYSYMHKSKQAKIVEIKSMKHEKFMDLREPLLPNVKQVLRYIRALQVKGVDVHPVGTIIYASKGVVRSAKHERVKSEQYKEFNVSFDQYPSMLAGIEADFQRGRVIKQVDQEGIYTGDDADVNQLPPRVCKTADGVESSKCDMCALCFGMRG